MHASAEPDVPARVWPVGVERVGVLELTGVAIGGAVVDHEGRAGGDVDAADGRRGAGQPEVTLDGALEPQGLLDEVGDALADPLRSRALQFGVLGQQLERRGQQPDRGLLARREEVGGDPHDVDDLGCRSVRERRERHLRHDVAARCPAAVLDVVGEPRVEVLQRGVRHHGVAVGTAQRQSPVSTCGEFGVVLLGHAEQIGDDE